MKSLESHLAYFSDGAVQLHVGTFFVTSDCPPSPHRTPPPPQCKVGEGARTYVELSHPPTPHALDICADLAGNPTHFHMDLFP